MPMAARAIFITGTDTDAGKTLVSCAILKALSRRGLRVAAMKPVETGCAEKDGVLVGTDCIKLARAAGGAQSPSDVAAYLLRAPAAPLVAAEAEGTRIDKDVVLARFREIAASCDFLLVEGAGGLMVPMADGYTSCDLARELAIPVVVVIASRLGCINHALLTLDALARDGIPVAGYVLNEISAGGEYELALKTNRDIIGRFTPARDLGAMPFIDALLRCDLDYLADRAEGCLDLDYFTAGTSAS
ncbi:MAG TPA: dethiobiotin synthase [Candidatus Binatia bacterium]